MRIKVIGSGAWGSAIAKLYEVQDIIAGRAEAQTIDAEVVFVAVKAQSLRQVLARHDFGDAIVILCSKGIELESLKLISDVAQEILPDNKIGILSGPNFAVEIAAGLPAASTLAIEDQDAGKSLVSKLSKKNFRLYLSDDLVTTQIAGAVKNVLAIACGISDGLKLGDNARAALITRGIAETARLAAALGGKQTDLLGLAGVGDLLLTCTSSKSRNYKFGQDLVNDYDNALATEDVVKEGGVKEGYFTAKAVKDLSEKLDVEMPICKSVYEILYENKAIRDAIDGLLQRPQK